MYTYGTEAAIFIFCLISELGTLARQCLIVFEENPGSLFNSGFGLKIGKLSMKLCRFWPNMIALCFLQTGHALISGGTLDRQITVM